jgi:large repetitive protein
VEGVNDQPVVTAIEAGTTNEDAANPFTVNLLSTATDPEGDSLTVSDAVATSSNDKRQFLTTVKDGVLSLDPGQFNDLAAGNSETITVNYNVSDGTATVANTATFVVEGVNDAPEATPIDAGLIKEDDLNSFTIDLLDTANVNDVDTSDVLTIKNVTATTDNGNRIVQTTVQQGILSLEPNQFNDLANNDSKSVTVNYDIFDGTATVANTATFSVKGSNHPPQLALKIPDQTARDTDSFSLDVSTNFSDADTSDQLNFSATGLPLGLAISSQGIISGQTQANGVYNVRITASDLTTSAQDDFRLTVYELKNGTDNNDQLTGNSKLNEINGLGGNDTISGLSASDRLIGGNGNDILTGGYGNDRIAGGYNNDTLIGGDGQDVLSGGENADVFVLQSNLGLDIITDFKVGEDSLRLGQGFQGSLGLSESEGNTNISILGSNGGTAIALLQGVTGVTLEELGLAGNQPT